MGLFRNELQQERYTFIGDRQLAGEKHLNTRGKAAAWLAALAAGFMFFSDEGLGAWGHATKERSGESMLREAQAKYKLAKEQASPSQLFALRYTDTSSIRVHRTGRHHSGIVGAIGSDSSVELNPIRTFDVKDGCLNDTAFDINGGQLEFNVSYHGLFSSVTASAKGDVPTAAAQASYNPDSHILTIKSGNPRAEDLTFGVQGDALDPEDQTTRNILTTYGCHEDVQYNFQNGV